MIGAIYLEKARELADASGTAEKAANIAASRGLTGAEAIRHGISVYFSALNTMAQDMADRAEASSDRIMQIIEHPAAVKNPGLARKLALETDLEVGAAIKRLESGGNLQAVEKDNPAATAHFILGAGR